MDREFAALLGSLTKEGQEKLINTISDFIQPSDVIDGLYKEAKKDDKKALAGAGLALGGSAVVGKQYHRGHLTGRETLYHRTGIKNVDSILEQGLKGSYASDPNNLTNTVLGDKVPKKDLENKVYLARKKWIADNLAGNGLGARKTLKTKVPTWMMKEVDNPELRGAKSQKEFAEKLIKENPHIPPKLVKLQTMIAHRLLGRKGTATLEGDVAAKYIKGSKHFERLGLDELKNFIKSNPKRFIKGSGKAALGLGAVGIGANMVKQNLSKKASEEEEKYINPIPRAGARYAGGFIGGHIAAPWIGGLLAYLSRKNINPEINRVIQEAVPAMTNPAVLGLAASVPGIIKDTQHNTNLKNRDRERLFGKKASDVIDLLYKEAKMEVPTPQEAKKEKKPSDDRPEIKCEKCSFEGKTTPKGECPQCGAIMGVKPSDYPIPYTPIWTGEPMSGISVNEASIRGRMEEQW
jgi:hypothetical protein